MFNEPCEADMTAYDCLSAGPIFNKPEEDLDLDSLLTIDKKVLVHAVTYGIIDMVADDYIRTPFVDFQHHCFIHVRSDGISVSGKNIAIDAYYFADMNKTWQLAKKSDADANDEFFERLSEHYSRG